MTTAGAFMDAERLRGSCSEATPPIRAPPGSFPETLEDFANPSPKNDVGIGEMCAFPTLGVIAVTCPTAGLPTYHSQSGIPSIADNEMKNAFN